MSFVVRDIQQSGKQNFALRGIGLGNRDSFRLWRQHFRKLRGPACDTSMIEGAEKVIPFRIHGFDQIDFPLTVPFLELLFAGNGVNNPVVDFVIDKLCHAIFSREGPAAAIAMRKSTFVKVIGYADIERAVLTARENVNKITHQFIVLSFPRKRESIGRCPRLGRGA